MVVLNPGLGSSSGAMLDTYVVEVLQSECVDAGYCTIQASSQVQRAFVFSACIYLYIYICIYIYRERERDR